MDFSLSDEQAMLKESVVQYIEKSYSFEQRMQIVESDQPFSADKWQEYAELGWLSLPFAIEDDGFGGGAVEMMLMMEELGKGLIVEPYVASVVFAGGLLKESANAQLKSRLLPALMAGESQLAVAYAESRSRFDSDSVKATATQSADGYILNGEKIVVLNGASADHIIVSVRVSGASNESQGVSLFCVPSETKGLARHGYKTVDGMHAAHVKLDSVSVTKDHLLSEQGKGTAMLKAAIDQATLAVTAEAVGIMDALTQKTVEYTKNREQFGVPLSSFQALQHRMVDMFMELEQSRSLLLRAAIKADEARDTLNDTTQAEATSAIAAAKYYVGTAGRKLGEEAIQLHGGMGVTREMDVAHLFMRLTVIDTMFGNADYQLSRFLHT